MCYLIFQTLSELLTGSESYTFEKSHLIGRHKYQINRQELESINSISLSVD